MEKYDVPEFTNEEPSVVSYTAETLNATEWHNVAPYIKDERILVDHKGKKS